MGTLNEAFQHRRGHIFCIWPRSKSGCTRWACHGNGRDTDGHAIEALRGKSQLVGGKYAPPLRSHVSRKHHVLRDLGPGIDETQESAVHGLHMADACSISFYSARSTGSLLCEPKSFSPRLFAMTDWVAKGIMLSAADSVIGASGLFLCIDTFCVVCSKGVDAHILPACCASCVRGSTLLPSWTPVDLRPIKPPQLRILFLLLQAIVSGFEEEDS